MQGSPPQRPKNHVAVVPFSAEQFADVVSNAASTSPSLIQDGHNYQTRYLANYLEALGARTLIVEDYYVDRHFMEEVSLYYSRCLISRQNFTTRIHVFSTEYTEESLNSILELACSKGPDHVAQSMQSGYCGYIVIRPMASVPIGRTVLKHFEDKPERKFPTVYRYVVHFLGLELEVKGLAFQQQDRAVAACATTAVWSALQRVSRRDGLRPPTSWEITSAAVKSFIPEGRPFPSPGLTAEQVCEALRSFGFAPDVFKATGELLYFKLMLDIYLRSGIPVILALVGGQADQPGHAVTVVGYGENTISPHEIDMGTAKVRVKNLAVDRLYVHDDRLGPYARARYSMETINSSNGSSREGLFVTLDWPDGQEEKLQVILAAAPLYPKLRSNARELIETCTSLAPAIQGLFAVDNEQIGVEMFFDRSGEYLKKIFTESVSPPRLAKFQQSIALSRYVGVIRWTLDEKPLIDTLWDTTDTMRETNIASEHLLGIVELDAKHRRVIDQLANVLGVISG